MLIQGEDMKTSRRGFIGAMTGLLVGGLNIKAHARSVSGPKPYGSKRHSEGLSGNRGEREDFLPEGQP